MEIVFYSDELQKAGKTNEDVRSQKIQCRLQNTNNAGYLYNLGIRSQKSSYGYYNERYDGFEYPFGQDFPVAICRPDGNNAAKESESTIIEIAIGEDGVSIKEMCSDRYLVVTDACYNPYNYMYYGEPFLTA